MRRNLRFFLGHLLLPLLGILLATASGVPGADPDEAVVRTFRQRIAEIKHRQERSEIAAAPATAAAPLPRGPDFLPTVDPELLPQPDLAIYLEGLQERLQEVERRSREAEGRLAAADRQAGTAAVLSLAALSLTLLVLLFVGKGRRTG